MLKNILIAGIGGFIGTALRVMAYQLAKGNHNIWATLSINILGSFIIGIIFALSLKSIDFSNNWKLFLSTGICGGFTTFSAFSLENLNLLQEGKFYLLLGYIFSSVLLGILATYLGYKIII
jgi:CrcB protein